jgi:hypothetical protein
MGTAWQNMSGSEQTDLDPQAKEEIQVRLVNQAN